MSYEFRRVRILIVTCNRNLFYIKTANIIFLDLPAMQPLFYRIIRVGLHALRDAQGTHIIARKLLGQQGEEAYGAALQGSTLALDVASQHVAEEAHLAPKVVLHRPRGKALYLLDPLAAVHHAGQHGAEEAYEHGAERELCIGAVVNLAGIAYELEAQRVARSVEVKTKEKV